MDKAQCGREEKDGGGIGSRGRGGVLGVGDNDGWGPNNRAADAALSCFQEGGPLSPPITVDHDNHDTTIKQHTGERGRRKMVATMDYGCTAVSGGGARMPFFS